VLHERRGTAQFPGASSAISPAPREHHAYAPPQHFVKPNSRLNNFSETTMILCEGENQFRMINSDESRPITDSSDRQGFVQISNL
jgi:hypothetical protein